MYTDRAITCLDCGQEFVFTTGEQEFYAQRGFTEPPKRCASCRAIRKAQRNAGPSGGSSSPYGRTGNGDGYASDGGYGDGMTQTPRHQRPMHEAPCADCGKTALLPFEPTGARPVYCSDCFQQHRV